MPDSIEERGTKAREVRGGFSVNLGRVAGIPIRLHFTFLLFIGWVAFGNGLPGTLLITGLFACVLLHELGHSLVARRYGIEVKEIVLYPIGGVAQLAKLPAAAEELWIALAGPAVNLVLALGIALALSITGHSLYSTGAKSLGLSDLPRVLMGGNVALCLFNMIPAFPMDGGRVLRAILALSIGEGKATEIAASIGQLLAILLGFFALVSQMYILLFIAFFVYVGAGQEAAMHRNRILVAGLPVQAAMITDFKTIATGASLRDAVDLLLQTSQQDFPVVVGEEVVGVLSRANLLQGLAREGVTGYVAGWMTRNYLRVPPLADLQATAQEMQSRDLSCALVMTDSDLLGIVTLENLAELLIVRQLTERA